MRPTPTQPTLCRRVLYAITGTCAALALATLIFTATAWRVHMFDVDWTGQHADAAIVLGAAAYHNHPSPVFRERIRHAVELYHQGRVQYLIFTGGKAPGSAFSEAEVARRYARDHGVPDTAILLEEVSRTTLGNLAHASDLANQHALRSLVVVSDPPHLLRAITMAHDLGLHASPAATPSTRYRSWQQRSRFVFRETYLLLAYKLQVF